jgi:Flp pilus assembly pilin Flp
MDDRSGASAVEYGLLSVLFVILIIGSWSTMGNELGNFFTDVANMFVNQAN